MLIIVLAAASASSPKAASRCGASDPRCVGFSGEDLLRGRSLLFPGAASRPGADGVGGKPAKAAFVALVRNRVELADLLLKSSAVQLAQKDRCHLGLLAPLR